MLTKLKEIDEKIKKLGEEREKEISRIIEEDCPYKIGDTVGITRKSHIYFGESIVIIDIDIECSLNYWLLTGQVIKKDGKTGITSKTQTHYTIPIEEA